MVDLSKEEILDKYKHLDQSDDFVGTQFPTPKGGVLTVVGWDEELRTKSRNKRYKLYCSICTEDTELWPDGIRSKPRYNLLKGEVPCGCTSGDCRWTEYQMMLRVKRKLEELGYELLGVVGDYKGSHTRLHLYNPVSGNDWKGASITNILNGGNQDPALRSKRLSVSLRKEDYEIKRSFYEKGRFSLDKQFKRNLTKVSPKGHYSFWDMYCPICSKDEYVQAGVCSGVFTATGSCFTKGQTPCRCSRNYKWNFDQRQYKVKKICEDEGLTFHSLEGKSGNVVWSCQKGHLCSTSVGCFINSNTRCWECTRCEGWNGWYPSRAQDQDYLYLIEGNNWIKCGRTFNCERRLKDVKRYGKSEIKILDVYTGLHEDVYKLEQYIKTLMYASGLNYYEGDGYSSVWEGSTECYQKGGLEWVQSIILNNAQVSLSKE